MKTSAILAMPLAALALSLAAPVHANQDSEPGQAETEEILMDHIKILASDDYMGRKPGTEGGRMTVAYQVDALKSYGYEPGWNGSFEQPVPLVATSGGKAAMSIGGALLDAEDIVAFPGGVPFADAPIVEISGADDIGDALAGKLVVLRDVRQVQSLARPLMAVKPAGLIVFAPQNVVDNVRGNAGRERVTVGGGDAGGDPLFMIAGPAAEKAFDAAREGKGEAAATVVVVGGVREFTSSNVIAKLPGTRPETGAIVMMAHWDHTGECAPDSEEDKICNGAVDNASGIAAILETAKRLAAGPRMERDVYIFGTTAEEMGLIGARYFADNPPRPLEEIHAALNIDTIAIAPANAPLSVIGWERTPLDESIKGVAASLGRTVEVEGESEKYIRRQDGWALMNKGVPSVLVSSSFGDDDLFEGFMSTRYHGPDDEIWEGFEIGGMASDVPVYVALMRHWATPALYSKPEGWKFDDGKSEGE